jgi:glycosyltransferase involved in cell wall biosynthesis
LLKKNNGAVVSPSQLNEKWFKNFKELNFSDNKLLYVGRLRVEKGIFSLIKILEGSKINLTIVSSERKINIKENYKNISFINFKNNNDEIIKIYDEHKILILPSFTESHPQVLDEALARGRPVIIFKDIQHVKRDREGVFVIDRNLKSLNEKINYINNNYKSINKKIKKNKLPTKKSFIRELKKILLN